MSAHGRETPPAGYSDKDSAPLIPGKQGKLKESFATAKNGHHKEHNSPQRKTPVPKLAQLRKWMRVDFNGGLSYIAVGVFYGILTLTSACRTKHVVWQFDSGQCWQPAACILQ